MSSRMQVLVVEDDETIRDLVHLALSDEGYDVMAAPHGKAALDLLQNTQPDVILLDMCMPVMDGWDFCRAYGMTPGPHAPVIILTAALHPSFLASDIKAEGYLSKPFDLDDLIGLVRKYRSRKLPLA